MSVWEDKLGQQGFWKELENLEADLGSTKDQAETQVESLENYSRVKSVSDFVRKRLDRLDPHLLNFDRTQELLIALAAVRSSMKSYKSSGDLGQVRKAASQCDALLNVANSLLPSIQAEEMTDIRERLTEFRRSAGQNLREHSKASQEIQDQANSVKTQLSALEQEIQSQKGRLDTAISDFQRQFSSSEADRSKTFEQNSITRATKFEYTQVEFRKEFDDTLEEAKTKFAEKQSEVEEEHDRFLAATKSKTHAIIDELEERKAYAHKLVGIITNAGDASGFQKNADRESRRALYMQYLAIISMVGIVVFAVFAYEHSVSESARWITLSGRIFAAGACGILAAYGAKQVERHRQNERYNRRLELILLSLDTYLASLPEEKAIELKASLANLIFDPTDKENTVQGEVVTTGTVRDILELLLKHLARK